MESIFVMFSLFSYIYVVMLRTFLQNLKNNGLSHRDMEVWLNLQEQSMNFCVSIQA